MKRTSGTFETTHLPGGETTAFVPFPLPPSNPDLRRDVEMHRKLVAAERALARLEVAAGTVASLGWIPYAFIRKEVVASFQVDGSRAALIDLLAFEATGKTAHGEVEEICSQIDEIRNISLHSGKLLDEIDRRRSKRADRPLAELEKYIDEDDGLPHLIRTGLVQAQFEMIRPYAGGNGRTGRMLAALLLERWGFLPRRLLFLSLHYKRNRNKYRRLLRNVRVQGDWESWCLFFLEGVAEIAGEAEDLVRDLFAIVMDDRERLLADPAATMCTIRLFDTLPLHPIVNLSIVVRRLDTSKPTAIKAISTLERLNILAESTGGSRNRTFHYSAYLDWLSAETGSPT